MARKKYLYEPKEEVLIEDSPETVEATNDLVDTIETVHEVVETIKHKPQKLTKMCNVLGYNKDTKVLDILFDNYGMRIHNVDLADKLEKIEIEYTGEIGKPGFTYSVK